MAKQKTENNGYSFKRLKEEYAGCYRSEISDRKVGLELEFPLVYYDKSSARFGQSLKIEDTLALFSSIKASNGRWEYTDGGLALEATVYGYDVVIGTDVGSGTLEIGFPPASNLREAQRDLKELLFEVIEAADRIKIAILGYGVQPLSPASAEIFAPKPRYQIFRDVLGSDNIYNNALTAANQVHVDVSQDEFAMLLNVFNGFAPALTAVSANSAILFGRQSAYQDFRMAAWDSVAVKEQHNGRTGIAPRVDDLQSYLQELLSHTPILTIRDSKYLAFDGNSSAHSYLSEGVAEVLDIESGEMRRIAPNLTDIKFLEGTVWWDARGKAAYGTIEVRPCALQPNTDSMLSIAALVLGISSNQQKANERIAAYSHADLSSARIGASRSGLRAKILGEPITELTRDMIQIAEEGLRSIGENTSYLNPIVERVSESRTNSDISLEILAKKGFEGFIDYAKLKR